MILVGTTYQILLFTASISLIGFCDSQDWIWGPHLRMGSPGADSCRGQLVRLVWKVAVILDRTLLECTRSWWKQEVQWVVVEWSGSQWRRHGGSGSQAELSCWQNTVWSRYILRLLQKFLLTLYGSLLEFSRISRILFFFFK